jgi:phage/plasmid-associated DNA primase
MPFTVDLSEVVEVDKAFPDKLKAEYSGILNWCLDGWKRYQSEGLVEPQAVINATAEYRSSEDIIGEFLRETSELHPSSRCSIQGQPRLGGKMTKTAFGAEMSKRYTKTKHTAGKHRDRVVYEGIGLLD